MKRHLSLLTGVLSLLAFPLMVLADESVGGLITRLSKELINPVIGLITGLAVLYFFWGVAQFIAQAGNEGKREEGKQRMIWGIIGLFVIFSVWGLVLVVQNTFFEGGVQSPLEGLFNN